MFFWIIAILFIVGGGLVLLWMFFKKMPELKRIDVDSLKQEQERLVKNRILKQRLERIQSSKLGGVEKAARKAGTEISRQGRRLVQRLYKMEQYYQKLQKDSGQENDQYGKEVIKRLMDEADEFIKQDEFIPAEKKYIEIISHNPKCVEAYEGLGNMYIKNKQYDQARETLKFALRLDEEDASVNMSLAELELALGNAKEALPIAKKAVEIRKRNPKYVDIYITVALAAKATEDIEKGIRLMKEVNPENRKIEEFESKLKELQESQAETEE